jgi:hypothetical protein
MRENRIEKINSCIDKIPYAEITNPFDNDGLNLKGKILISFDELDKPLEFEVIIGPQYPFKSYDTESIKFLNNNLLEYNHVMADGTICIHTSHSIKLKDKIQIDFLSLKNWVIRYYINKDNDNHYEHLIVPDLPIDEGYYSFIFTDVKHEFKKGDYGLIKLSQINDGQLNEKLVSNFITQSFADQYGKELALCNWSSNYKNHKKTSQGIFLFVDESPSIYNRFLFQDWNQFEEMFTQDFLDFLHATEKMYIAKKLRDKLLPFFIGYKISDSEIHWQVAMLKIGDFPIYGITNGKVWQTALKEGIINWTKTRNSSYHYFFGRGTFCPKLASKRILVIGVGAIGSCVARTLVKGGIKQIDLADYDIKEPENVSRSEYHFFTGITEKVHELGDGLSLLSPFVEVGHVNQKYFEYISKVLYKEVEAKKEFEAFLDSYDLIFDCTTDNDLMYVLDSLNLKTELINLSITNHAKDLVCSFSPNIYSFVTTQYADVLDNDIEDLYNPTGCWSPTFKASYNDIAVLVQYALKQINLTYDKGISKNSFVLKTNSENGFEIKLHQY